MIANIINNINISDYLQASFWTASGRSELGGVLWFILLSGITIGLGVIILALSSFFIKDYPPKKKLLVPFSWFLIVGGINGLVFGLLRVQGVSFFSAYGFWFLIILSLLGTVGYFGFRYIFYLPKEQVNYETLKVKKRYLPKRKKRG